MTEVRGTIAIHLPDSAAGALPLIEDQIRDLEGVSAASSVPRSVDAATAIGWFQVGAEALTAATAAVELVRRVVEAIRSHGLHGATLTCEGIEIEVDNVSTADIERLVAALRKGRGRG